MQRLLVFSLVSLQRRKLIMAAAVAFCAVESCVEEDLHQLPRQGVTSHESPRQMIFKSSSSTPDGLTTIHGSDKPGLRSPC